MRHEDIKPGTRVICVYRGSHMWKLATIMTPYSPFHGFSVRWDDPYINYADDWSYPTSFELATDQSIQHLDESIKKKIDQERRLKHAMQYL